MQKYDKHTACKGPTHAKAKEIKYQAPVINSRRPVRRQLWTIPSEEDDDVVVDEELYQEMLRDRRQQRLGNSRHRRRVKRALQRLGALENPKRHRRDDDYDIRDL